MRKTANPLPKTRPKYSANEYSDQDERDRMYTKWQKIRQTFGQRLNPTDWRKVKQSDGTIIRTER